MKHVTLLSVDCVNWYVFQKNLLPALQDRRVIHMGRNVVEEKYGTWNMSKSMGKLVLIQTALKSEIEVYKFQ
jgi:hypothetical protein